MEQTNCATALLMTRPAAIVATIMWSGIEASASIICANLPTYWPLVLNSRSFIYIKTSFRSKSPSRNSPHGSNKAGSKVSTPYSGPYRSKSTGKDGKASGHVVVTEIQSGTHEVVDKDSQTWLTLENECHDNRRDVEMGVIRVDTRMSTGSE